jgi:hypothetical protein
MKKSNSSENNKRENPENLESNEVFVVLEYYSRPFMLLGEAITNYGYDAKKPHEIRERFWSLLPPRIYEPFEIKPLLKQYIKSIERDLASIISKHSLAYWLHIYRRIAPYSAGLDEKPITIGLVRVALEAAFQKYALSAPCDSIGFSKEIPIEKILSGLLLSKEFKLERDSIKEAPKQMVLTNFSTFDLLEIYKAEKLAYEMWRSTATLRIIGKGASVTVTHSEPFFFDNRSDELSRLIQIFDSRIHGNDDSSLTGISFANLSNRDINGTIFLPTYNMSHISSEEFGELFLKIFKFSLKAPIIANFIWVPFNIRNYRNAHIAFSEKFYELHKVDLDSLLLVITALCNRVFLDMLSNPLSTVYRYWQRAYEGPLKKEFIINEILTFIPQAAITLNVANKQINNEKILKAIQYSVN